ncbi:MAG: DegT/DnrJ/EryC1/StrS aminotransferase family protein [Candidatus Peregrinibacteria bacterium]|nr:DegT/DnrJ/EryC1/StrS aminotransferase family protein [Candidatus Peregrinibacteria bacterium]MCB9808312.1 DegT/DnrJ/EryC1/StrS aminotransferase family protein [Candidatus Peribacteria bacterium]
MTAVIHHTFGPHCTPSYIRRSLGYLIKPWTWQKGENGHELQATLSRWFEGECTLFGSGRDALLAILRACNFESGSEIIIQGFTCVALPNAIHAAGYTPIFADTNSDTLNLDLENLSTQITTRTKAIICQHTFGIVADVKALRAIADKHDLLLIEDCAHIIPDVTGPKVIGKYADAIMLSFGRDKAASGILGGAAIAKNTTLVDALANEAMRTKSITHMTIGKALLYPLLYGITKPLYGIGIGKLLMSIARKLGILIPVLTTKEKQGVQQPVLSKMPNACAGLVKWQLKFFHSINNHRRTLTTYYLEHAQKNNWQIPVGISEHFPLQKFPIYVPNADEIRNTLKKYNIYLDDGWTGATVCPRSVSQESAGYILGSCPHAERIDREILTLPTHPTMTQVQAQKLAKLLSSLVG